MIARLRAVGLRGVPLTRDQRRYLRRKNGNAGISMPDGTTYVPTGNGMVASGANTRAIVWSDYTLGTVRDVPTGCAGIARIADNRG